MKLKLDENLGQRCMDLLQAAGHDVATVAGQSMNSAEDDQLLRACAAESRALITLDKDFANPLMFPPDQHAGVAVLRLPSKPSHATLLAASRTLVEALNREELQGRLWSVEPGRIRIYQPPDDAP